MRLETITIPAHKVELDSFIFLPKKGLWFFVDDLDHDGKDVIFISEIWLNRFEEKVIRVGRYQKIMVLTNYNAFSEHYENIKAKMLKANV